MGYLEKIANLLTEDVIFLLNEIENAGYEARIVGGAVRNLLLDMPISDVDIAASALPAQIIEIFRAKKITVIPSGINHGTVTVILHKTPYEITTLRKDVQTFGRKATVSFCKSFETDSNRRDFTMNAIYMDKKGCIYDYHNGLRDIAEKNVRFIGDAKTRIAEDYLRIFRYFRFVAYYGDLNFDSEYLRIINEMKDNISRLSLERILGEMLKILALKKDTDAAAVISEMKAILDVLFDLKFNALKVCNTLKISLNSATEKFCLLLRFSNVNCRELVKRYTFPKNIKRLLLLSEDANLNNAKKNLQKIRKTDRSFFINWLMIFLFVYEKFSEEKIQNIRADLFAFCDSECADFNFHASDLAEYNLSAKELAVTMKKTKEFWISSENANYTVESCKKFAENFIKQLK